MEGALKLAKGYHRSRQEFVTVAGSLHGASMGSLAVSTDHAIDARDWPPLLPVTSFDCSDLARLAAAINENTIAVILEPIRRGIEPLSQQILTTIRERCSRTGGLLISNETCSGLGRTGDWFVMQGPLAPDIMVVGPVLGGGVLPMCAYSATTAINGRVYGRRDPLLHATTTGGNPAACAAGRATIDVIEREGLLRHALGCGQRLGQFLKEQSLQFSPHLPDGFVRGLLAGLRFASATLAETVCRAAFERGLLLRTVSNSSWLSLRVPMIVSDEELERGLVILNHALAAVCEEPYDDYKRDAGRSSQVLRSLLQSELVVHVRRG
jgi:acetylornithine/succinyldiaminopimelate/putrescine aminotransferase